MNKEPPKAKRSTDVMEEANEIHEIAELLTNLPKRKRTILKEGLELWKILCGDNKKTG